jgi:hypothetical protein
VVSTWTTFPVVPYRWPAPTWWTDPTGAEWEITVYWADVDGHAAVVGLDIHAWSGEFGEDLEPAASGNLEPAVGEDQKLPTLSAALLRQLPFRRVVDQSWQESRAFEEVLANIEPNPVQTLLALRANLPERQRPRGKRGSSAAHLALVANIYREARARRDPPTRTVAETLNISHSTAAKRVAAARRAGLLEPTRKGSTGGIPVPPQKGASS